MRAIFITLFSLLTAFPLSLSAAHGCGNAQAYLGIYSNSVSKQKAKLLNYDNRFGSFVTRVYEESAAAEAGLQPMDYIFGIDDKRTSSDKNLTCLLQSFEPGNTATLHFIRKGQVNTSEVTFRDRTKNQSQPENPQEQAFLGVEQNCNNCHQENQKQMGIAVDIVSNSTAQDMGLQDGDRIMAINEYPIVDWPDLTAALNMIRPGEEVTIAYERSGQVQQATQPIRSRADMGIYTSNNNYDDYAYLGIHTNRLTEEKAAKMGYDNPYGTVVSSVIPNTAADKAGLQVLDYLYGIDEYRLGEEQSLRTILKKYRPDDSATLLVYRKGEKRELAVTFGERTNDDDDNDNDDECEDPFLGVRKQHDNDPRDGVAVNIVDNSTAEAIKMKDGDLITYINGYRILDWTDLRLAINMIKVGQPIAVTVERNGNTLTREGRIMSECEFDEYDGDSDDDWEDKLEDKMEKLGEDLERMGEEIGEKVGQAMENLFDGSNRSDRDDAEADNDDWYEEQKRRRRTDADREMPIDQVAVEMEDMEEPEMRQLAANAKIDMPQNRVLMVNELTLSPNPNMGMFVLSFDLPNMGDTRIRIFNALGRLIYEYELGDFSGSFTDPIDISQNGAGAYFLLVEQNGQAMTKKIILTKD